MQFVWFSGSENLFKKNPAHFIREFVFNRSEQSEKNRFLFWNLVKQQAWNSMIERKIEHDDNMKWSRCNACIVAHLDAFFSTYRFDANFSEPLFQIYFCVEYFHLLYTQMQFAVVWMSLISNNNCVYIFSCSIYTKYGAFGAFYFILSANWVWINELIVEFSHLENIFFDYLPHKRGICLFRVFAVIFGGIICGCMRFSTEL